MVKVKHFFMDMDGSICESKTLIKSDIKNALNKLPNVYVISGASRETMQKQLEGVNCKILAQSGNYCDKWIHLLSQKQIRRILKHIKLIEKKYGYKGETENRGSQIAYSFTGHNADLKLKKEFDSTKQIRNNILEIYPFKDKELMVTVAGNTCFDYTSKKGTKGVNLKEYIKDLNKEDCIYFGDNLQEGGNDHSVVGVMKTVPVTLDTILDILEEYAN